MSGHSSQPSTSPIAPPEGLRLGFWRAPRWLPQLLEDRDVTPTGFALLTYLAVKGADREEGLAVSYSALAAVLDCTTQTVGRALRRLRDAELVDYTIRPGQRSLFRLHLGARLRDLETQVERPRPRPRPRPSPRPGDLDHQVEDEVTSSRLPRTTRANPLEQAAQPLSRPRPSRARGETETEKSTSSRAYAGEAFAQAVAPLGTLTAGQWQEAHAAWRQDPARVERCAAYARAKGDVPVAYFMSLVRDGADPIAALAAGEAVVVDYPPADPSSDSW